MNKKRFTETLSTETVHDNLTGIDYKPIILSDELLELINALHEENMFLKKYNKDLIILICDNADMIEKLECEIEELKKINRCKK